MGLAMFGVCVCVCCADFHRLGSSAGMGERNWAIGHVSNVGSFLTSESRRMSWVGEGGGR